VKVLIYGAGVIGSLYAGKLKASGHRVTVLARGARLHEIRQYSLIIQDITSGAQLATQVETTERVDPDEQYDIALVTVRWINWRALSRTCKPAGQYRTCCSC
jgi:2-dehydropantoate 2-reductase